MKIDGIGAGGVGGYHGALLAVAGNEIDFVSRGRHVEAMRNDSLQAGSVFSEGRESGIPKPVASAIYFLLLPLELRPRQTAARPTIQFPDLQ